MIINDRSKRIFTWHEMNVDNIRIWIYFWTALFNCRVFYINICLKKKVDSLFYLHHNHKWRLQ